MNMHQYAVTGCIRRAPKPTLTAASCWLQEPNYVTKAVAKIRRWKVLRQVQRPALNRISKAQDKESRFKAKYIDFVCDKIGRTDVYLTALTMATDLIWK